MSGPAISRDASYRLLDGFLVKVFERVKRCRSEESARAILSAAASRIEQWHAGDFPGMDADPTFWLPDEADEMPRGHDAEPQAMT